jgi:hypothetical protein
VQHCDPEALSLVALGEPAEPADAAHLTTCTQCQGDVAELATVVSAVRVDLPDGPPVPPPPRVWNQIAAQTGVRVDPRPAVILRQANAEQRPSRHVGRAVPRRDWRLFAVAASALLVGAIGGSLITRSLAGSDRTTTGAVVAQAQLAALPAAPTAGGRATVVRAKDGEHLVVDVSRLGPLDGRYYEVWLIDTSVKQMVAVGILSGTEGEFVLPGGLDLSRFPVVDISVQEPGNPLHSGKSVLRGTLPA